MAEVSVVTSIQRPSAAPPTNKHLKAHLRAAHQMIDREWLAAVQARICHDPSSEGCSGDAHFRYAQSSRCTAGSRSLEPQ